MTQRSELLLLPCAGCPSGRTLARLPYDGPLLCTGCSRRHFGADVAPDRTPRGAASTRDMAAGIAWDLAQGRQPEPRYDVLTPTTRVGVTDYRVPATAAGVAVLAERHDRGPVLTYALARERASGDAVHSVMIHFRRVRAVLVPARALYLNGRFSKGWWPAHRDGVPVRVGIEALTTLIEGGYVEPSGGKVECPRCERPGVRVKTNGELYAHKDPETKEVCS